MTSQYLEGWDKDKADALLKEILDNPVTREDEFTVDINTVLKYPLLLSTYPYCVQCVWSGLALLDGRQKWFVDNVVLAQLERAFQSTETTTESIINDMAAALGGLEKLFEISPADAQEHIETFWRYGTRLWNTFQKAMEDGPVRRVDDPEVFRIIGLHRANVDFTLAFWRCRHAIDWVPGYAGSSKLICSQLMSIVESGATFTASVKSQLAAAARTQDGRGMLMAALAHWTAQRGPGSSEWFFVIQLLPWHILLGAARQDEDRKTTFPIMNYYLELEGMRHKEGKRWKPKSFPDEYHCLNGLQHVIGVDKAILVHLLRIAKKSPVHTLPFEVIEVLFEYIYSPHTFPKEFYSRYFSLTKGKASTPNFHVN